MAESCKEMRKYEREETLKHRITRTNISLFAAPHNHHERNERKSIFNLSEKMKNMDLQT